MSFNGARIEGNRKIRQWMARHPELSVEDVLLAQAEALQVVHSSYADPGVDWSRFDFFNAGGELVVSHSLPGY